MPRYVLTGAPGAGKTAILRLQRQREQQAGDAGTGSDAIFFDRSPVCTLALSRYLGLPASALLAAEVDRIARDNV